LTATMSMIITIAQMHLAEMGKSEVLDAMLPGFGRPWGEILAGSQTHLFHSIAVYAAEWEAVATRWANEDHALLQPPSPCWIVPPVYAVALLKQTVAKKELEL
jgi:hypothetical protein